MDQDETWHAGRPWPRTHCVRWGPSSPTPKGAQPRLPFSAHICCGQRAAWIKTPLGMEVGLGLRDILIDGDPAPPPVKGGGAGSPIFGQCSLWPNGWMDSDATWYGDRPRPRQLCVRWGLSPLPKGSIFVPLSINC